MTEHQTQGDVIGRYAVQSERLVRSHFQCPLAEGAALCAALLAAGWSLRSSLTYHCCERGGTWWSISADRPLREGGGQGEASRLC